MSCHENNSIVEYLLMLSTTLKIKIIQSRQNFQKNYLVKFQHHNRGSSAWCSVTMQRGGMGVDGRETKREGYMYTSD